MSYVHLKLLKQCTVDIKCINTKKKKRTPRYAQKIFKHFNVQEHFRTRPLQTNCHDINNGNKIFISYIKFSDIHQQLALDAFSDDTSIARIKVNSGLETQRALVSNQKSSFPIHVNKILYGYILYES